MSSLKRTAPGSKNPKRVAAGKRNILRRPDFQAGVTVKKAPAKARPKKSHDERMRDYREQLLSLSLDHLAPELAHRLSARSQALLGAQPKNSEIALYSDVLQFARFCADRRQSLFPITVDTLTAYLQQRVARGHKRSSISRSIASLARWCRVLELDDFRRQFDVEMALKKLLRQAPSHVRQAEGLRPSHLELAIATFNPEIPRDLQDVCLLFVGFETLCRGEELVRFCWRDLKPDPDASALLYLSHSKTDQSAEGEYLYLSPNTHQLLQHWQAVSGGSAAERLFRGLSSSGLEASLSAKGVARCFKRIAARVGFDPKLFSAHSARVGGAQTMVELNIEVSKILLSGRWKTTKMLTRYAKKITAKHSGTAEMMQRLQTKPDEVLLDTKAHLGRLLNEN